MAARVTCEASKRNKHGLLLDKTPGRTEIGEVLTEENTSISGSFLDTVSVHSSCEFKFLYDCWRGRVLARVSAGCRGMGRITYDRDRYPQASVTDL